MRRVYGVSLLALAILLGISWGCGRSSEQETRQVTTSAQSERKPLTPFELLIDWQAEPTYLGVYYAKTIGEFEKLGLDVNITQSWGANEAAIAVSSGKYKIATASGGATAIANSNGAGLVSMAVLYHSLPTSVYGLASTGIRGPHDLEGRTIGIYPKSITRNEFEAFAKLNGLDMKKIEIVAISGADIPLVLSGKVDGAVNYFELSPTILALDTSSYDLRLSEFGVEGYGLNIICSRKTLLSEPDLVNGVTQAILAGYRAALADPEAAVSAFLKEFPDKDPTYVRASWAKVCGALGTNIGAQTAEGWQKTIDLYRNTGVITAPVTPANILP